MMKAFESYIGMVHLDVTQIESIAPRYYNAVHPSSPGGKYLPPKINDQECVVIMRSGSEFFLKVPVKIMASYKEN